MADNLPAGEAPAAGAEVKAAPQSDSQTAVVDSTKSTAADIAVVTVEEEPDKPASEEAKSGFLSSISGLLTGKPATPAHPHPPAPVGRTFTDENGKAADVSAKVISPDTAFIRLSPTDNCSSLHMTYKSTKWISMRFPRSTSLLFMTGRNWQRGLDRRSCCIAEEQRIYKCQRYPEAQ